MLNTWRCSVDRTRVKQKRHRTEWKKTSSPLKGDEDESLTGYVENSKWQEGDGSKVRQQWRDDINSTPTCTGTQSRQQTNHSLRKQPLTGCHWADNTHTQMHTQSRWLSLSLTHTHMHTNTESWVKSVLKSSSRELPNICSSALLTALWAGGEE